METPMGLGAQPSPAPTHAERGEGVCVLGVEAVQVLTRPHSVPRNFPAGATAAVSIQGVCTSHGGAGTPQLETLHAPLPPLGLCHSLSLL